MRVFTVFMFSLAATFCCGQMIDDGITRYGNEWIDYSKTYCKIAVSEDGVYKVSRSELSSAGYDLNNVDFAKLELYHLGKSVPFYISPDESFIEFYGERTRDELDRYVYGDDSLVLNTEYSVVSDVSSYFLVQGEEDNDLRFNDKFTNLTGNTISPEPYYVHEEKVYFNDFGYKPTINSDDVRYSNFVPAEGYGTELNQSNSISIELNNRFNGGPDIGVDVRFGTNAREHRIKAYLNNNEVEEFIFGNNNVISRTYEVDGSSIGDNLNVRIEGLASTADKNLISNINVRFPRIFDITNRNLLEINLPANTDTRYLELSGAPENSLPFIYDFASGEKILPQRTDQNKIGFFVEPSSSSRKLIVVNSQTLQSPDYIESKVFNDYSVEDINYIIVTNKDLRKGAIDQVEAYKNYRQSETGGNFKVLIADVDQLYDQYAYGVDRHFIAIKNFGFWTKETYSNPEYMFIIGKGLEYFTNRTAEQVESNIDAYVPTFGLPGSDNLLLGVNDNPLPIYPIGRLAARSPEAIGDYLDKVMQHDENRNNPSTVEGRLWQKRVLHLSGGDTRIQGTIASKLALMEDTIRSGMIGADVNTFFKKSADPIEDATSDLIFEEINNGLLILTFFGHSSVGTFDFALDNVENYENRGKYPLLFSLGCFSGNVHTNNDPDDLGISEDFVLAKDKGAIAFIAASGTAYIGTQDIFGRTYYSKAGGELYGTSIGKILRSTIAERSDLLNFTDRTFLQQLTLHGDPAVQLPSFETPDIIPDKSTAKTNPKFVDTYEDEFEFCIDIVNLGKSIPDSIDITLQHINPKEEIEYEVSLRRKIPSFSDELCVQIPISSNELVGKNVIKVIVDSSNEIIELPNGAAEANNVLRDENGEEGFPFFILNNSAIPTFPEEFSIVTKDNVNLIANTFNALGDAQPIRIELDTTRYFDSSFKQSSLIENVTSTAIWDLEIDLIDGVVYYWRVGTENEGTGEIVWRNSSFLYDTGERNGWNQSHFFQFTQNSFVNMEYENESESRDLKFVDNVKDIRFLIGSSENEYYINATRTNRWRKDIPFGIIMTLFDPDRGDPVRSFIEAPLYGSVLNTPRTTTLQFPTSTLEERQHLISVIRDSIPENYIVNVSFVSSSADSKYNIEDWIADEEIIGTSILQELENRGASKLEFIKDLGPVPYVFAYENGTGKNIAEEFDSDVEGQLDVQYQIKGLWDMGDLISTTIGPASKWNELTLTFKDDESLTESDTTFLDIIGITDSGVEDIIAENLESFDFDLASISAESYPYLKFIVRTSDITNASVIQPDVFRVYYEGIPDLSLNSISSNLSNSEIDQGQKLNLNIGVSNISNSDMGATQMNIRIINSENESDPITRQIAGLSSGESINIPLSYDTRILSGDNVIEITLNEEKTPNERYFFNNFALDDFTVKPDTTNPSLDVTFDGVTIMNDDIVSSKPLISIELSDDNRFILLDDPENISLTLKYPNKEEIEIETSSPDINFFSASEDDNTSRIEFTPSLEEDGRYKLFVSAKDQSGNAAGNIGYEVEFRVFNEEKISDVFNYPNPFSTSTQFIFTLTGDEEPQNMLIRIMTITGKVVREITQNELGDIRIGLNRTSYKWDGTDEFGEKLANGTYLYQVVTKKQDGTDYENFVDETQNNTNYLFTENFGKLVIIR